MAATLDEARAQFRAKFLEAGISERADDFLALARPAIFFRPAPRIFEDNIPVGASKIGGRPDLPANLSWPKDLQFPDIPLTFLAQINLRDVPHSVLDIDLPQDGLLSAFAAPYHMAGLGRFVWFPPNAELARRSLPPELDLFPPRRLKGEIEMTIDSERPEVVRCNSGDELSHKAFDGRENEHVVQLGGDPFVIQNSMEDECDQRAGDKGQFTGEDARWALVLQVDSVDEAEMNWGDGGSVYFFMRVGDLRKRRFERAVVNMQCY